MGILPYFENHSVTALGMAKVVTNIPGNWSQTDVTLEVIEGDIPSLVNVIDLPGDFWLEKAQSFFLSHKILSKPLPLLLHVLTISPHERILSWFDQTSYSVDQAIDYVDLQKDLVQQKRRLEDIIVGTQTGTWEWYIQTGKTVFNQRWAEIAGYTLSELEPISIDTWVRLAHPDDLVISNELLQKHFMKELDYYQCETRIRHKDGHWVWILDRGKVSEWDDYGRPVFMSGTHQDISEQKRIEGQLTTARDSALAANKAKSEFLANMSHEIRTPLNGILGFTDLLLTTELSFIQKEYAQNAHNSGKTLLSIINDILDLSKIEAGKLEIHPSPTNIYNLVDEVIDLLNPLAMKKGLLLMAEISPTIPCNWTMDGLRLRQVLLNLVGNGIKFTASGSVILGVSYRRKTDTKGTLEFHIIDTGIGISLEEKANLFQSFSQADNTITRRFGGTGLGLVISNHLVSKMGGKIDYSSTPGLGSDFSFSLELECLFGDMIPRPYLPTDSHLVVLGTKQPWESYIKKILTDWELPFLFNLEDGEDMGDKYLIQINQIDPGDGSSCNLTFSKLDHSGQTNLGYLQCPIKIIDLSRILCKSFQLSQESSIQDGGTDEENHEESDNYIPATICIAEDVPLNMKLIKALLKRLSTKLILLEASTGVEVLPLIQKHKIDLILMDVQMPEMDGIAACQQIRAYEHSTQGHVPIVALSAGAMHEERQRCFEAGMDNFLAKPINREELVHILYEYGVLNPPKISTKEHFDRVLLIKSHGQDLLTMLETLSSGTIIEVYIQDLDIAFKNRDMIGAAMQCKKIREVAQKLYCEIMVSITSQIEGALKNRNLSKIPQLISELSQEWRIVEGFLAQTATSLHKN